MENIELKTDIECAKNMLKGVHPEINFSARNSLYYFTTENIGGYLKSFNLKNKKVLTVTSSGDHAFNAILLGAREIDCFDINRLTTYYMELKKAGIMTLDFSTFARFFTTDNNQTYNPKIYEKVREILDDDTKFFWDSIYEEAMKRYAYCPGDYVANSYLFYIDWGFRFYVANNLYLSKRKYNKLKDVIGDAKISYTNSSLLDLPKKLNIQYDLIMLSTISDYLHQIFFNYPLDEYRNFILNHLSKLLGVDGQIILAYIYNIQKKQDSDKTGINTPERRNAIFNQYFSSVEFKNDEKIDVDAIYIYKKQI